MINAGNLDDYIHRLRLGITGTPGAGKSTFLEVLGEEHKVAVIAVDPSGTLELILLCEAAGYDVVSVETVGVGQSETEVPQMVDCFLSLQIAGAGDDLQGIKKGIMEMADIIVIHKDDGDNHANIDITRHMYHSALHIIRRKYPGWQPCVLSCSALEKHGIGEVWQTLQHFWSVMRHSGQLARLCQQQNIDWVHHQIESNALSLVLSRERSAPALSAY